jgi:hypothetical protein
MPVYPHGHMSHTVLFALARTVPFSRWVESSLANLPALAKLNRSRHFEEGTNLVEKIRQARESFSSFFLLLVGQVGQVGPALKNLGFSRPTSQCEPGQGGHSLPGAAKISG